MALPLPYAPNIDVDAERLRMAREKGARPTVDVGGGIAQGISTGLTLKGALDADNKKAAAEVFQKEYLDKGNEGLLKAYKEAGEPKDFPIQAYLVDSSTPPDKAREHFLLGYKDLTGYREKAKKNKADAAVQDLAKDPNATSRDLATASGDTGKIIETTAAAEALAGKALEKEEERKLRETIKKDGRAWDKTMATFRAGLERDTKAGKATVQITDDLGALEDLAKTRAGYASKKRLTDTDKIEYADVVRQMSIINERIAKAKRDGAVAPKDDKTDTGAEDARAAIANGAPAESVYDRYKSLTGKRHPDDKRK